MTAQRVGGGGLSGRLSPFGVDWSRARGAERVSIGQQIQRALFGRTPPTILDPAQHPELLAQLRTLARMKKKIVTLLGDDDDEYPLSLAAGGMVMIDGQGRIYMGQRFLLAEAESEGTLVGALAHEVGHRPKRWGEYRVERELTRDETQAICREEEAKADAFAGVALAELGLSPDPLCAYLVKADEGPHPEYFPVEVRTEIIREAHRSRAFRADFRRKMFRDLDRQTSAKGHLGEF